MNVDGTRQKPWVAVLSRGFAATALLATAGGIDAAVVTETESFNLASGSLTASIVNNNRVVTFPSSVPAGSAQSLLTFSQFNAALGTLTGVTFTLGSNYSTAVNLSVTPTPGGDGVEALVNYFAETLVTLRLLNVPTLSTLSSPHSLQATCIPQIPSVGCSDPDTASGAFAQAPLGLSPLAAFIGPGTFDVTASLDWTALLLRISPDNGTNYADNTTITGNLTAGWAGDVSISYIYDAATTSVPEPTTLYLVGGALAAAGWLRRRKS
jgi:hypothetical protein